MTGEPVWPPRRESLDETADELEKVLQRIRNRDVADSASTPDDPLYAAGEHYRRCRSRREALFDDEDPADAAWDILIDLYLNARVGRKVSVSSASIASLLPPTTALRWISRLDDAGLLAREKDPRDRRRVLVVLTSKGEARVRPWLASLAGIPAP